MLIPETSPWLALIWVIVTCFSLAFITMTIFFMVYMIKAMIRISPKVNDDE